MECHYHPDRESTDSCAICGKSVCKECGLEIAGKVYCKECLEKIVGLGIEGNASSKKETEDVKENYEDDFYEPQEDKVENEEPQQSKKVDSPYNVVGMQEDTINQYTPSTESDFDFKPEEPQIKDTQQKDFIYPEHNYQPSEKNAKLEDKYEKYLDDLYFDEEDIPLSDQLAKDEEKYGSLTRREYKPRPPQAIQKEKEKELMESAVKNGQATEEAKLSSNQPIHNLNYQEEKESMGVVDILLIIILILVILMVIYYLVYIFILSSTYPTFTDALFALQNPQNIINTLMQQ